MQLKTLVALTFVAAATATDPIPASQCTTGPIQCCNSVQAANTSPLNTILGLLGIVVNPITALVGLACSPVSVGGAPGNSCNAQPVCCTGNNFSGLLVIGCTPVNLNL